MYSLGVSTSWSLAVCLWPSGAFCSGLYCLNKLLWQGMRAALICRYTYKHLECGLELCLFSKVAVLGSPLGPVAEIATSNWLYLQCQAWISLIKPTIRSLGGQDLSATIVASGTSRPTSHCCGSLGSQIEKSVGCLSLWAACMDSSKPRAGPQRELFHVRSRSTPPTPVTGRAWCPQQQALTFSSRITEDDGNHRYVGILFPSLLYMYIIEFPCSTGLHINPQRALNFSCLFLYSLPQLLLSSPFPFDPSIPTLLHPSIHK